MPQETTRKEFIKTILGGLGLIGLLLATGCKNSLGNSLETRVLTPDESGLSAKTGFAVEQTRNDGKILYKYTDGDKNYKYSGGQPPMVEITFTNPADLEGKPYFARLNFDDKLNLKEWKVDGDIFLKYLLEHGLISEFVTLISRINSIFGGALEKDYITLTKSLEENIPELTCEKTQKQLILEIGGVRTNSNIKILFGVGNQKVEVLDSNGGSWLVQQIGNYRQVDGSYALIKDYSHYLDSFEKSLNIEKIEKEWKEGINEKSGGKK